MANKIYLPYSKLNVLKDCNRCFFFENHPSFKIARPEGIFSSMPAAIDAQMKEHADTNGEIGGVAVHSNRGLVAQMRNWRKMVPYELPEPITLFTSKNPETNKEIGEDFIIAARGALDDIAEDGSPLDFKSKGKAPEPGYSERYYQTQADLYALFLTKVGIEPTGKAKFVYWVPSETGYDSFVQEIDADPERAIKLLEIAAEVLSSRDYPLAAEGCNYCNYFEKRLDLTC